MDQTAPQHSEKKLAARLADFALSDPILIETTPRASIWKVTQQDGSAAALKLYHRKGMKNDAIGAAWMVTRNGSGSVRILGQRPDALLMEWLEGPTLGDLSRRGQDDEANVRLVLTAARLHAQGPRECPQAQPLDVILQKLFDLSYGPSCPVNLRADMQRATELARHLLATTETTLALHGDLHHDNVILTEKGSKAFDAHTRLGDPAFEFAQALASPDSGRLEIYDAARTVGLAKLAGKYMGVDERRVLGWGAVKRAQSVAKSASGILNSDNERARNLSLLLALATNANDGT